MVFKKKYLMTPKESRARGLDEQRVGQIGKVAKGSR